MVNHMVYTPSVYIRGDAIKADGTNPCTSYTSIPNYMIYGMGMMNHSPSTYMWISGTQEYY